MLRKSSLKFQATRENLGKNINRPVQEAPPNSWNNDTRFGQKQVKAGDPDPMIMRFLRAAPNYSPKMIKARIISNNSKVMFCTVMFGITGYFFLPTFKKQSDEAKGLSRMRFEGAESMAEHSPRWWSNQWRKGAVEWRGGESAEDFYVNNFKWIKDVTGQDMLSPPVVKLTNSEKANPTAVHRKGMFKALVPLCGDSPIVRVLAEKGYFVHGVECSEVAMQSLSKQIQIYLAKDLTWNVKLHWTDFFNPDLWSILPGGLTVEQIRRRETAKASRSAPLASDHTIETNMLAMPDLVSGLKDEKFDFIYDRQALSSFHPGARTDYSHLLKKALKDDGVLFVEGIFRTGRVKGNKVKGPPYGVSEAQLAELFTTEEGFSVKCDNSIPDSIFSLDKSHRILGSIPKELYSTPIPCVVWRPSKQQK